MTLERWPLPQSWKWVEAIDVAEIVGGGTPSTKDQSNFAEAGHGTPWIGPADLTGYTDPYIKGGRRDLSPKGLAACGATMMPKGAVLFSSRAPIGYCAIAAHDISTNQGFKSWVCVEDVVPEFVRYYLLASVSYIDSLASGTTFREVSGKRVGSIAFPLCAEPEQRRIVAKLDALTARLTGARAELDRVPGLTHRLRTRALSAVFALVSDAQRLREITESVTSGSRGWSNYYSDAGPMFIRVGDVRRCDVRLSLSDVQRVQPPAGAEGARTAVRPGDLVITITADLGRVGVVPKELEAGFVNQHVALVRLQDPRLAAWIAWYLSSEAGQRQMVSKNRGVTKAGLGLDDIRDVLVPIPCRDVREAGVRRIEAAFARADRLEAEAARARGLLDRLEAAILAKAFRGELVPQDPDDEPAAVLLDRIRAGRAAAPKPKRRRATKGAAE